MSCKLNVYTNKDKYTYIYIYIQTETYIDIYRNRIQIHINMFLHEHVSKNAILVQHHKTNASTPSVS